MDLRLGCSCGALKEIEVAAEIGLLDVLGEDLAVAADKSRRLWLPG
jgi:hypothetical protein